MPGTFLLAAIRLDPGGADDLAEALRVGRDPRAEFSGRADEDIGRLRHHDAQDVRDRASP